MNELTGESLSIPVIDGDKEQSGSRSEQQLDPDSNQQDQSDHGLVESELQVEEKLALIKNEVSSLAKQLIPIIEAVINREPQYGRLMYLFDKWSHLNEEYGQNGEPDISLATFFHSAAAINLMNFLSVSLESDLEQEGLQTVSAVKDCYKFEKEYEESPLFSSMSAIYLGSSKAFEDEIKSRLEKIMLDNADAMAGWESELIVLIKACQIYIKEYNNEFEAVGIDNFLAGLERRLADFIQHAENSGEDEQSSGMKIKLKIADDLREVTGATTFNKDYAYVFLDNMISNAEKAFALQDARREESGQPRMVDKRLTIDIQLVVTNDGSQQIQIRVDDNADGFQSGETDHRLSGVEDMVMGVDLNKINHGWVNEEGVEVAPSKGFGLQTQLEEIFRFHHGSYQIGNRLDLDTEKPIGATIIVKLPIISQN